MKLLSSFHKKTEFSKRIWDITENSATQKVSFQELEFWHLQKESSTSTVFKERWH